MVDEYILVGKHPVKATSSVQKHKHLPSGRIFRRRVSHEGEEQTPRVVGADKLAVLGAGRENGHEVASLKVGICEQLSHTFCDVIHGMNYLGVLVARIELNDNLTKASNIGLLHRKHA